MRLDVLLGRLRGMMRGVRMMSLCQVRVMCCCLVLAVFMMLCSLPMMVGRLVMMLGSLRVMVRRFLRHVFFLSLET